MISSLEKKPLKNGTPHSAAVAMIHVHERDRHLRASPPMSFFMSKLWWLAGVATPSRRTGTGST